MTIKKIITGLFAICITSCNTTNKEEILKETVSDIHVVGTMKNVIWKGELEGRISLDTISDKKGLYGLGPESYLKGELLINNGICYVSEVTSDSTMTVEKKFDVSAPFFVYANVSEWNEIELPSTIKTIPELEQFIEERTREKKRPFAFKLKGTVSKAVIHIQNLPEGTQVASPDDAHKGQVKYELENTTSDIIGFFSTEHKGIFTHHDSYLHMHLITEDESKMGHLDDIEINTMTLYLPKN
ncbi:acetolactate decarboxylase [Flavobacterium sediminis]|uniref:acetolactate decarboxylase n=1 Tax=Flavobacterium sediminis TaxID=2201181 RepID=UPI0015D05ABE|nr:acetolactate decarboxylase [Flavobacterium sediminis]